MLRGAAAGALLGALWLGFESLRIGERAAPFVKSRVDELPEVGVGLVLGCSKQLPDGRRNLFFEARMAAAAELFRSGKVRYLLVSGDNSRPDYDEPTDMQGALIALGVPASRIVLDYAGFRTLDSVVRAKTVFGVLRLIVVSQRFHNERAVYLARAHGVEAFGYDARDIGGVEGLRVELRELVSRVFAVLDVKVQLRQPRFPGPPERTPLSTA